MRRQLKIISQFLPVFLFVFISEFVFAQMVDPKQALSYEIASAGKKELIDMAAREGLSISGSENDLRSRLYTHFSLQAPQKMKTELLHAEKIYSGQMAGIKESVTRLSGGVKIQITEANVIHQISAENIIIYQKTQVIYASGGVHYELKKSDGKQIFFAKNMMFNTQKWASLLVEITGQTTVSTAENNPATFYLTGKQIEKTITGLVLLDNVIVTSCDEEDPHYRLRFGRLWSLNDKETVMQNMTMYLGHVPILYLPFYYHAQDVLFFNPVIGYRSPAGIFYNTTTYLYGKKSQESTAANMFSQASTPDQESQGKGYLKLILDYYSQLGVFGGLSGYIPVLNTNFIFGVGYSHTIFPGGFIYELTSGPVKEQINTSTWFGVTLPFRFGIDLQGEVENFSYRAENYTDPYFAQDFFFREENASFLGFLSGLWGDNPFDEIYQTESYLRYKNTWKVDKPGLSTFAIDYFNFEFVSTVRQNNNISTAASPNYYFYLPSTFNLPNIQMRLEGDWVFGGKKTTPPVSTASSTSDLEKSQLLLDNNLELLTVPSSEREYESSFFYRWQINERMYYQPSSAKWARPEDVKLLFDDVRSLSVTRLNFGIQTQSKDRYFLFREGFQLDLQYLFRFNESASLDPSKEKQQDEINRFFTLSNVFDISYFPLLDYENWAESGFEYHMTARVFQNIFDQSNSTRSNQSLFLPDKHYINGQIRYDTGFWWGYFSTKTEIPPNVQLTSDTRSGFGFEYWGISSEAYVYVSEGVTTFNSKGYGIDFSYTPIEKISFYETTQIDFFSGLNKINVGTSIYGFKAELRWEDRYLWDFSRTLFTWQTIRRPDGTQDHGFVLSYLDLQFREDIVLFEFLDNRGRFSLSLDSQWLLDFIRYDQSTLRFGFGFGFDIDDFIQVKLSTNSINRATYLYFPFMRDKMGITTSYDFFSDLWDSFSFWDISARQRSNFKLENIQASVSFDLHDWMLTVIYIGGPKVGAFTVTNLWENQVSFLVTWKALPAITAQGNYDDLYGLYLGSTQTTR